MIRPPAGDVLDATALGDYVRWLAQRGRTVETCDELWLISADAVTDFAAVAAFAPTLEAAP